MVEWWGEEREVRKRWYAGHGILIGQLKHESRKDEFNENSKWPVCTEFVHLSTPTSPDLNLMSLM